MIFGILKVSGRSLVPVYQDGDFVIVSKIPVLFNPPHVGQVVVFQHPTHHRMIKRVERVESGGQKLFVVGENDESLDSRAFGPIPTAWVEAVVLVHVRQPNGSRSGE